MSFWWNIVRTGLAALTIVVVSELSQRHPKIGGLLLSLPLISILAFAMSWQQHGDLAAVSRLARETLILVPLGLVFFVPMAFAQTLGLGFWQAFAAGMLGATITLGLWIRFGF